ncbi:hypothetical protein AAG570_007053 [Ranatra chinensis]|uniref:Uncharacterized protein n=1 Tax=Ranatra chinensis TaxID=642074 RepID=A0ABD0XUQ0_9HEMI
MREALQWANTHSTVRGSCPPVIAYASKKLTPAESRYTASSVWFGPSNTSGLTSEVGSSGSKLIISPWSGLRGEGRPLRGPPLRRERLAPYPFRITHTKSRDNVVADCLSRMVNAIDSPSFTLDVHNKVTWDPENFDLSLLGSPEGESLEPPGLSLFRRRVEEGPDLPAIPEAAARMTPVSRPESERGSAECRELLWKKGSLNDKARQLSIEIVPGTDVRTSSHRYGQTRMESTVAAQFVLCVVCARAKYVRISEEPPQMVTPTPKKPLEVVEADVVFLDGTIRLTIVDRPTRFAASYPLARSIKQEDMRGGVKNKVALDNCLDVIRFTLPAMFLVVRNPIYSLARSCGVVRWLN